MVGSRVDIQNDCVGGEISQSTGTNQINGFVPPYLLRAIAERGSAEQRRGRGRR